MNLHDPSPLLLTKQQLAEKLGVRARTVESLHLRGAIPSLRISPRCLRFDLAKVRAALERYEVPEVTR